MIYVGGVAFSAHKTSLQVVEGSSTLDALLEHPLLISASNLFKTIPEKKFSISTGPDGSTECKCVYIFQREYATVDPAVVDLIGTDEATTCVCLVIRNRRTGMTSVAHLDSPDVIEIGIAQMLSQVIERNVDAELDVHILGGFEDASPENLYRNTKSAGHAKMYGYSYPLCAKIVEVLQKSKKEFHIQTFFVLRHNTAWNSEGIAYPIFNGVLVETLSGSVFPASFDRSTRAPDEIVRRIRVSACYADPNWIGKLLETYDTQTGQFKIAPCTWTIREVDIAMSMRHHSDSEILLSCSTSPFAEGPDFVDDLRRTWDYLIQHPDWRETFPKKQPRVFQSTFGSWEKCDNC